MRHRSVAAVLAAALSLLVGLPALPALADEPIMLTLTGLPDAQQRATSLGALWDDGLVLGVEASSAAVASVRVTALTTNSDGDDDTVVVREDDSAPFEFPWVPSQTLEPGRFGLLVQGFDADGALLASDGRSLVFGAPQPMLSVWNGLESSPWTHGLATQPAFVSWRVNLPESISYRSAVAKLDGKVVHTWFPWGDISPDRWGLSSGQSPTLSDDLVPIGKHRWDITVTDWAGYVTSRSTTFWVDTPLSIAPLRITDTAGRTVTPSTWVLAGSTLRVRTSISASPAYAPPTYDGGVSSWSVRADEGNGTVPALAGVNNAADTAHYACLNGQSSICPAPISIDRAWKVGPWSSTGVGHVEASAAPSAGDATQASASYRIYPQSTAVMRSTARTVRAGSTVTVSGRLTRVQLGTPDRDQPGIRGEVMVLQRRLALSSTWTTVATATTSSAGNVSATIPADRNAQYRWSHADHTGSAGPATSAAITLTTSPAVTLTRLTATPNARSATSFRLSSSKPQSGGSMSLQRWTGSAWKTIASAKQSSTGTATVRVVLPAGSVKLRAVAAATPSYGQGISASATVSVRR